MEETSLREKPSMLRIGDRARVIVVVCGSGNRASVGASILLRNGYTEVYIFLGAMSAWNSLEYPLSPKS